MPAYRRVFSERPPPLLGDIRRVWWFQRYYSGEMDLLTQRKSKYGFPLEFHRKAIFECSAHWHRLQKLSKENAVPEEWFEGCREAVLEELLREAAIYYPKLLERYSPALQIRPHSFAVDTPVVRMTASKSL
jgi:hypothetical protein